MSDNFFSRWSRRKQGLDSSESPAPEQAVSRASTPSKPPPPGATASLQSVAKEGLTTGTPMAQADDPQPPLPTMADVKDLTPASNFQTFMRQGVPGEVRNAAMKKLFTDPHFNVMDGLDIYIGDYNTPDPLPAGMLEKMVGAELLNLFPKNTPDVLPALANACEQENPEQSPDTPEGASLVAQSPPSPLTPAVQATPALHSSESTEHDHLDLQLQPNHAPAGPSSGSSAG